MKRIATIVLALFALIFAGSPGLANVPPHVPGEICLVPEGWCWASSSGTPGEPCVCGDQAGIFG